MKKILVFLLSVLMLSFFNGCAQKFQTIQESKENFLVYEDKIKNIATKFGVNIKKETDANISNQDSYIDLNIDLNQKSNIYIRIINLSNTSNPGEEIFTISYSIKQNNDSEEFNLDLFLEIVNCISNKTLTQDDCKKFLQSSENEYSAEKYGLDKPDDLKIYKILYLDYIHDSSITYSMDLDNNEELCFTSPSKA